MYRAASRWSGISSRMSETARSAAAARPTLNSTKPSNSMRALTLTVSPPPRLSASQAAAPGRVGREARARRVDVPCDLLSVRPVDAEPERRGQELDGLSGEAGHLRREPAPDAGRQAVRPDLQRAAQAADRPPLDLDRGVGRDDVVVEGEAGVEPPEPGHAIGVGVAGVFERRARNPELDIDGRPGKAPRNDRDRAPVSAGSNILRDLEAAPQRLDLSLLDGDVLFKGRTVPVGAARVEAGRGRGRDDGGGGWRARLRLRRGEYEVCEFNLEVFEAAARGPDADLKREVFARRRLAAERLLRSARDPAHGQVAGHADGEAAVLRKKQIGRSRMGLEERLGLGGRGDDFHRVESAELVRRLDLDDFRLGKKVGLERGRFSGRQSDPREPAGVGRRLRRVVLDVGIVLPALGFVRHVVEEVIARHGPRLEEDIA